LMLFHYAIKLILTLFVATFHYVELIH
jgi:hypothetical protein